jgi:hypothetical protein
MKVLLRVALLLALAGLLVPALAADEKPADAKQDAKPDAPKKEPDKKDDKKDAAPDAPKKEPDKKDDKKEAKKDAKKAADKKEPVTSEKSAKAGQLTGKVVSVDEKQKAIKLELTLNFPKQNVNAAAALAQAQIDYRVAAARRDVGGMANAQQRMAINQAQSVTTEPVHKTLEVTTTDDVKVRVATAPSTTDEKGKVRQPTAKELKELKGDPRLPGYQGEFSNLRKGQTVRVTLVKNKDAPKPKPGAKPKDVDELLAEFHPQASMIEIITDPN